MKPFAVVLSIFLATALACSSVFAEDAPKPQTPPGATVRELEAVTKGKKVSPAHHRKAKVETKRRLRDEDYGC